MMVVGLLWAVFAPLLLLIPAAALYRFLRTWHPAWRPGTQQLAAVLVTLAGVLVLWLPARREFSRVCGELGAPRVIERVRADGFYLDDPTANSFGTRYLYDEGFKWYEARDIYHAGGHVRYIKSANDIRTEQIDSITAAITVASVDSSVGPYIRINRVVITERRTGRELATAARANFSGGPARIVLGVYGASDCPSVRTASGSEAFDLYYHLARATLR
jgi:hypothetical protein